MFPKVVADPPLLLETQDMLYKCLVIPFVAFKCLYSLGYFELFDLLHHIRPLPLLTFISCINAAVLWLVYSL